MTKKCNKTQRLESKKIICEELDDLYENIDYDYCDDYYDDYWPCDYDERDILLKAGIYVMDEDYYYD
jgi:hypothetical protein